MYAQGYRFLPRRRTQLVFGRTSGERTAQGFDELPTSLTVMLQKRFEHAIRKRSQLGGEPGVVQEAVEDPAVDLQDVALVALASSVFRCLQGLLERGP